MEDKKLWSALLISVVAVVAIYLFITFSGTAEATQEFAECLGEKEAVMYGTDWCHYCQDQKEMFGMHFEKLNYIDCDDNKAECDAAGVRGYPTWVINEVNYPGVQKIDKLAELSGCKV